MNKKLTPRYVIIGLVLLWAVYSLWPTVQLQTLSEAEVETMREEGNYGALESKAIKQGLDLKGGMYIVLEVDLPALISNLALNRDEKLNQVLKDVTEKMDQPEADFFVLLTQAVTDHKLRLLRYYHEYGSSIDEIITNLKAQADDAINRVLEILRNRVDQFGVSEPTIQKQGEHRIIVELAGIQDPERARALLQSTALLEFFLVKDAEVTNDILTRIDKVLKGSQSLEELAEETEPEDSIIVGEEADKETPVSDDKTISVSELFGETEADITDSAVVDQRLFEDRPFSSLLRNFGTDIGIPEKNVYAVKKIINMPEVQEKLNAGNGQFLQSNESEQITNIDGQQENIFRLYYLEKEPELTGGVIEEANERLGSQVGGQPVVLLDMNNEGAKEWARITGANIGRRIAIVLDKKVHMAPSIREKISQGGTQIEGFADMNEAKDIAIVLRAGALPAPVNILEERIVGPSLGADSVKKGTLSVLVGLALVLLFMLFYYKLAGLIADFALIWNILLVLAVLASLQATLTLPGIAALILTVGMSIDANVIIFERIREELRKGKSPKTAIDGGYARALTTIIDANITTVIAALVLYQFGTGPIRGFATVLFWGIVISMFTAIFVTRTIFNTLAQRKGIQRLSI